jgi:chromosome segregation ATPase
MQKFDPEALRTRFHEAGREKEAILASLAPLRAEYEAEREAIDARRAALKPLETRLREAEAPMVDLDRERAHISRMLQGKTGRGSVNEPALLLPLVKPFSSVEDAKSFYLQRVRTAATSAQGGLALTDLEKKEQAVAVLAMGQEAALALPGNGAQQFPLLAASVPVEAADLYAAATLVIERYEAWATRAGQIEAKRIATEHAITAAADADEVRAAFESAEWTR